MQKDTEITNWKIKHLDKCHKEIRFDIDLRANSSKMNATNIKETNIQSEQQPRMKYKNQYIIHTLLISPRIIWQYDVRNIIHIRPRHAIFCDRRVPAARAVPNITSKTPEVCMYICGFVLNPNKRIGETSEKFLNAFNYQNKHTILKLTNSR